MEIAAARESDIPAILALWGDLARLHASLDPVFTQSRAWRAAYEGYLSTLFAREDVRMLVARKEGRVVAYGMARITTLPAFFADRRRGFIQDVVTHPDHRGQGIGRRLVQALLAWLADEGIHTVELTIASANREALRFWERLGFDVYMHQCRKSLRS